LLLKRRHLGPRFFVFLFFNFILLVEVQLFDALRFGLCKLVLQILLCGDSVEQGASLIAMLGLEVIVKKLIIDEELALFAFQLLLFSQLNSVHNCLSKSVRENLALFQIFIEELFYLVVGHAETQHVVLDVSEL